MINFYNIINKNNTASNTNMNSINIKKFIFNLKYCTKEVLSVC